MTSDQHGFYAWGYTHDTMVCTESSDMVTLSESISISQSGLRSETRPHEVGIASNRKSECYGECVPGSCTHRPSRHGR